MIKEEKVKTRILIAEDEGLVAADIKMTLESFGYTVCSIAATGDDTILKCGDEKPDLVIMDIMLAGEMDGIAVADRIKSLYDIPVVYLTAYSDEALLQRAKKTEPFGYLIKPFSDRELHSTIEMALYNHMIAKNLRQTEARLTTTLRSIGDGVIATDREARVQFMNPVAQELTGWKEEEAKGKPLPEVIRLLKEETGEDDSLRLKLLLQEGRAASIRTHILKRNGDKLFISDSLAPIIDEKCGLLGMVLCFSNITEKRRTDQKLRQSEEQYRLLFDLLPYGGELLDSEGVIVDCSISNSELLGYARTEMTGRHITEFLAPESITVFRDRFPQLRQGETVSAVIRMVRKDGSLIDVERAARPLYDAEGKFSGVLALNMDITEQKKMQEALRESEERYRMFVEHFQGIAFRGSMDFTPVFFHGAVEQMTGYKEEDFICGHPRWDEVIHPDDMQKIQDSLEKIRSVSGYETEREYRIINKNGQIRWVHELIQNLADNAGKPVYVQGAMYDITGRRELEEELRKYEHIVSSSSEHMSFIDRNYVYQAVNEAYLQAHNKERNEIIGHSVADLLTQEVFEAFVKKRLDRCLAGEEVHYEQWFKFPTLGRRFMDVKYYPFRGPEGIVAGVVVVSRDITERMRMEEELKRHNEQLEDMVGERTAELETARIAAEAANRAKSEFLANMSHELRTPLNSILGFGGLIRDGMAGPVSEDQKDYLGDILESGDHLLHLINDILAMSQLDLGTERIEVKEFSLRSLLEGVIDAYSEKALKKKISLNWDRSRADEIGTVAADELKIRQVLYNLLDNAIKFTPDGGSVRVHVHARKGVRDLGLGISKDGIRGQGLGIGEEDLTPKPQSPAPDAYSDYVEISVTDTGIGISAEDQQRLFRPFLQGDQSITKKYAGTGLGLSLCKKFVELHGGRIWVESEAGKGSRFAFAIPLHAQIRVRAVIDQETKLPTFSTLLRHIQRIISFHKREHKKFGLLSIQLDQTGGNNLRTVIAELLNRARRAHEILAHADEEGRYYLLAMEADQQMTEKAADRLAQALEKDGHLLRIKTAVFPDNGETDDALLKFLEAEGK